ncbi:OLC1v1003457C1 [Oldenlandia corymbosa var. corymbosa]|uniref:OLC1v1003457C1 n=1 Tax=Oldenlandia corymbosa var. corymbosa TaxID=529605 RepID=A0AAV1DBY2_OLDCO|nr:OLC1v1003457C1 [Oldenlandia corymbosa var. corymbosa]
MENGVVAAVNGDQLGETKVSEEGFLESRTAVEKEMSEGGDDAFVEALEGDVDSLVSDLGVEKFEDMAGGMSDDEVQVDGRELGTSSDINAGNEHSFDYNGVVVDEEKQLMTDGTKDPDNMKDGIDNLKDGYESSDLGEDVVEKLENGEQSTNDQGHEPLGGQNANEVKGGSEGSNLVADRSGNDFQLDKVNEVDSNGHQDERLIELENVSSIPDPEHVDSPTLGLEHFPAKFDSEQNGGDSPSSTPENEYHETEAVQANNIASLTDHEGRLPEVNASSPLVEKSETAEGENLLSSGDSVEKIDSGSNGLIAEIPEGPEPPQETSIDESVVVGKEMASQMEADLSAESSSDSKAEVTSSNAEISDPLVKELHVVSSSPYSEADREDVKFMEVNQSGPQISDRDVPPTTDASSTTSMAELPARPAGLVHPSSGARGQESNAGEQGRSVIGVSVSSNGPVQPRPTGLGRAAPLLEPASRHVHQPRVNGTGSTLQNQLVEDPTNGEAEETDETREKLQMIRVKFLRLAHRLGQTPHNVVVAQVLYRLGLAEQLRGRSGSRVAGFSFDRASSMAEQLEASGQEPLDFSCTIMVLGKSGVGKSATINSIFDEVKFNTDAFQSGTKKVQDVVGTVQGIKVRVIDTPGLLPSYSDQRKNEKTLRAVRQYIKKTPPDIILYLDRLDMPSREFGDMPLLRTITEIFGPSIWFNAIVVLTHAASAPPEGPNGATGYDMFVTQRSHVVQQAIRHAAGDMRLMNPVSLVENHSACRTNRAGQRVLPNGQVWKPHLLLLSFASKILAEANTLLKLQDTPPGKPFAPRSRATSLPFLLSSLLQSRSPVKLPAEQYGGDDDDFDDDLDESSDSEDESAYEELPPFKPLTKAQLEKLPKDQRKQYHDELEYRERLFMKQQLKEEKKRRKLMKELQAAPNNLPAEYQEQMEEESSAAASVPVPMPDLALPASFDSDNPTHRYRCLDSSNQWLVRPVLDPNSWDHDVGYEGINVERLFSVKEKIPVSFSGQFSKDKKDTHLQMEMASTIKHGIGKSTSLGFDLQSMGRDIVYTLRSETRFNNWRKNKALAGVSVTLLGDTVTGGLKIEDKLIINKRGQVVVSAGAVVGRGDVAYGGSLEATLRDKDHPLGRFLSTLGLSVMDWHGDLAIGCNLQSQVPVGRSSNLIGRVSVNNRGSGQVSIRFNSSEHLQLVLFAAVPIVRKLLSHFQPVQY